MTSTRRGGIVSAAGVALLALLAAGLTAGAVAADPEPGHIAQKHVVLDRGRLWGTRWKVVAWKTKDGFTCQTLIRQGLGSSSGTTGAGSISVCTDVPSEFDPVLSPASWHEYGSRPTTIAVIGTSAETSRVRMRLVPGGHQLELPVRALSGREQRLAGMPEGFRYVVVAIPRVVGLRDIRALDVSGGLLGRTDGFPAPVVAPPAPEA